jgi:transcriptional regulator of acetoin/glycerol metabolism
MRRLRQSTGKEITGLTPEVMDRFTTCDWPGNVREFKSALEYAFVVGDSGLIDPGHLPPKLQSPPRGYPGPGAGASLPGVAPGSEAAGRREALVQALREAGGNQSEAARRLGVSRVTVWNRMRRYGIDLKRVLVSSAEGKAR